MNMLFKPALAAGIALAALAAPAAAQVNGIATSNPALAIAQAQARDAGYKQIEQTFATQFQQVQQLRAEQQQLEASLDTNGDQNISEQEVQANPAVVQQIQQKEQQLGQATQPIALAQYYVIEQLLNDFPNARQQVIEAKGIQVMLAPDAIQYGPQNMDVTQDIVAALNQRLPSVATAVPQGWQPRQNTAQVHQAVQQILVLAAAQAQARAQQGTAAPATQQPVGR